MQEGRIYPSTATAFSNFRDAALKTLQQYPETLRRCTQTRTTEAMFHDMRHSRVNNRYREQILRVCLSTRFCYWRCGERFARMICGDCSLLFSRAVVRSRIDKQTRFSDTLVSRMRVAKRATEFSNDGGFPMEHFRRFPKLHRRTEFVGRINEKEY